MFAGWSLRPSRAGSSPSRLPRSRGFTLIEVVVVLAMLVMVLITSYQILNNCLETERTVEKLSLPEKVGGAILATIRRDLSGAFHVGMAQRLQNAVFIGVDRGTEDEIRFLTTVDPTPSQDAFYWDELGDLRTVCAVAYFLEPNGRTHSHKGVAVETFTLYRKEITDFSSGDVLRAPGFNQVIYDKVKSFDIKYYDGWEWLESWDSAAILADYEADVLAAAEAEARRQDRIARVSAPEEGQTAAEALPPSPLPVAVRIELEIYAGTGNVIYDRGGEPDVRTFTAIVEPLAGQQIPIEIDEALAEGGAGDMAEALGGADATRVEVFGGGQPGVGAGPRGDRAGGRAGRFPRGDGAGPRGGGRLGGRGAGGRGGTFGGRGRTFGGSGAGTGARGRLPTGRGALPGGFGPRGGRTR